VDEPLDVAFYLDTSINIQRLNLDHYFFIIENILRNFAFMHEEYKFKGQNRIVVFGFYQVRGKLKIDRIWEPKKRNIDVEGTTSSALSHVLVNLQTTLLDPSNIHGNPATTDAMLFTNIKSHYENLNYKGKAIILRDGHWIMPMRMPMLSRNFTEPYFFSSPIYELVKRASNQNLVKVKVHQEPSDFDISGVARAATAFICDLADEKDLNLNNDEVCYFKSSQSKNSYQKKLDKFTGYKEEQDCCVVFCQEGKVTWTLKPTKECMELNSDHSDELVCSTSSD